MATAAPNFITAPVLDPLATVQIDPTDSESARILEEMLQMQPAPEPGMPSIAQVVSRMSSVDGNDDGEQVPLPQVMRLLTSAGYSIIYDTRTGQPSVTNNNMLPAQMKKKREDGSRVFTGVKPNLPPSTALRLCCKLHISDPNRAEYDRLGLATCRKSNLASPFQVNRHMKIRHRVEWDTLEEARLRAEKDEDRQFQRDIAILARGAQPATVAS